MDTTKFDDLNQQLAECEKKLYDKIAEECAGSFETAIYDSIKKINNCAANIDEIVKRIQSSEENIRQETEMAQKNHKDILLCIDKLENYTNEYIKVVQETPYSLLSSLETYKNDCLFAINEQNHLLSEIKEEQHKTKKRDIFIIIPVIIVVILQVINLLY